MRRVVLKFTTIYDVHIVAWHIGYTCLYLYWVFSDRGVILRKIRFLRPVESFGTAYFTK